MAQMAGKAGRLRAVDLFAGGGGFSVAARMAGVDVVAAVNHDPRVVRWHKVNHPEAQHGCYGLDTDTNYHALPAYDILIASPCCLPGTQAVVMADGTLKRADQVNVGDTVLTGRGRGRAVVNRWVKAYTGQLYRFTAWGDTKLEAEMTADHRVWVRRREGKRRVLGEPVFVRADEVRAGDYVGFPRVGEAEGVAAAFVDAAAPGRMARVIPSHRVPAHARQGRDVAASERPGSVQDAPGAKVVLDGGSLPLWWLLGHYLGDGQSRTDRDEIIWYVGGSEDNLHTVRENLAAIGLSSWVSGEPGNVRVCGSSKHLAALCRAFGSETHLKRIPDSLLRLERAQAEAMLDGYLAADGSSRTRSGTTQERATSVSLALLQGFQALAWRMGWPAGVNVSDKARVGVIQGRTVQCRDSWELWITRRPHAQSRTKVTDTHVWRSVRSVEARAVADIPVYDFEVYEDHTFCLPGVVVHNCQGHSNARGEDGPQHDASRATALAVVACMQATLPDAIVIENVPEFARWGRRGDGSRYRWWLDAFRNEGYHVSENVLDAADFGAPSHRVRLFLLMLHERLGTAGPVAVANPRLPHVPAGAVIDRTGRYEAFMRPVADKCARTRHRVERLAARLGHPAEWVFCYRGRGYGYTLADTLGTITTKDQWAYVRGGRMRFLQPQELRAAMGFPDTYELPATPKKLAVHMIGNAVSPPVAQAVIGTAAAAIGAARPLRLAS